MNETRIRQALIRAANLGNLKIFNKILKKYPEHPLDDVFILALIIIVDTRIERSSIHCLRRILNQSNINSVNAYGDTPLLTAVKFYGKNSIPIIVESGANLEAKDIHGYTALDHAVHDFKLSTMAYLISKGARITSREIFAFVIRNMLYIFLEESVKQSLDARIIYYLNVCWTALKKQYHIEMDALDKYEMKKISLFVKNVSKQEEKKTVSCYRGCIIL